MQRTRSRAQRARMAAPLWPYKFVTSVMKAVLACFITMTSSTSCETACLAITASPHAMLTHLGQIIPVSHTHIARSFPSPSTTAHVGAKTVARCSLRLFHRVAGPRLCGMRSIHVRRCCLDTPGTPCVRRAVRCMQSQIQIKAMRRFQKQRLVR